MIVGTSSGRLNLNFPYAVMMIVAIAPMRGNAGKCSNPACKELARIYDDTDESLRCDDFYTAVCAKWTKKVVETVGKDYSSNYTTSTETLVENALRIVVRKRLLQVRRLLESDNAPTVRPLPEEIQMTELFMSCLRTFELGESDENDQMTLRKLFHEIGLPFFGEAAEPNQNSFSAMMKANLIFGFEHVFSIRLGYYGIEVLNVWHPDKERNLTIATLDDLKTNFNESVDEFSGPQHTALISTRFGSLLDMHRIRVSKEVLFRMGRHTLAAEEVLEDFGKFGIYEVVSLKSSLPPASDYRTLYDAFVENMGGMGKPNQNSDFRGHLLQFMHLDSVSKDPNVSQVIMDYLAIRILEVDLAEGLWKDGCKRCNREIPADRQEHCATLVSVPHSSCCIVVVRESFPDMPDH